MSSVIRLLNPDDLLAFRDIFLRSLHEEPAAFLHDYEEALTWPIERLSGFIANIWMAGAFMESQLVGFAGLGRKKGLKLSHKGSIGPVYVTPEARGQKLAAQMIVMLEDIARAEGIEQIMLSTDATNKITQHIYQRLGYEPWGIEKHILKLRDGSYVDDVVMAKSLL